jgi:NAD+ diphosphatase
VSPRDSAPNFFAGPYADRRSEAREDPEWLRHAREDPDTRWILARGTSHLLHLDPEPRVAFLRGDDPSVARATTREAILLGWFEGARCVLVEGGAGWPEPELRGARFEELRPVSNRLPADEAALLGYARALAIWRARHRFCGVCGAPTVPERAGHALRCTRTECAAEIFPRIDPAIIVLVSDGERALLGRQRDWPDGRYSTIAGFVEPGESLEDAVAREVLEETNVIVTRVDYHSSQPWPFPSSIMLGFLAQAAPGATVRAGEELEDARWFTRAEIASGFPVLPPRTSISHRLIEDWYDSGSPTPLSAQVTAPEWEAPRA